MVEKPEDAAHRARKARKIHTGRSEDHPKRQFGARCRALRMTRGLTVNEIAKIVDMPSPRVSNIELGALRPYNDERLERFLEAVVPNDIERHTYDLKILRTFWFGGVFLPGVTYSAGRVAVELERIWEDCRPSDLERLHNILVRFDIDRRNGDAA